MEQTPQDYDVNDEHFPILSSQLICVCCLAENVPLMHLLTCKHRTFFEFYNKIKIDIKNCLICYMCHGLLKKIDVFIQQVEDSCTILSQKAPIFQKLEQFQCTQVLFHSLDPNESFFESDDNVFQDISMKREHLIKVTPLHPRNELLEITPEIFELNTDMTIDTQGNMSAIEGIPQTMIENTLPPNKCIKCQILYDDITLSDLEKHNQHPDSYVCESCNLEFNTLPPEDDNLQYISDPTKLQPNFTELYIMYPNDGSETQINNVDNQYNDNGYNEYDTINYDDQHDPTINYDDYFEDGHNFIKKDSAMTNNNDITNNDNDNVITKDNQNDMIVTDNHNEITKTYNQIVIANKNNESAKKYVPEKKRRKRTGFKKIKLTLEEQKAELETKRKEKKYMESVYKCFNCAVGFLFKDTYQAHMMRHEESNGEYKCDTCTLRFASLDVLRAHTKLHVIRVQCRRCGARPSPRQTRPHAAKCRGNVAPCHLCARVFRDATGLQQHLKRYHQSKTNTRTYSCNVCGKNYDNQAAVRTHMIKHLNRKFTCDRCSSTFNSPYTLNQHKKKHDNIKSGEVHYCEVCKLGYSTRKSLLAHKRNALVHQQTVFECPVCNRVCPNQRALTSHMSTMHAESKDHACPTCGSRYASRKALIRHQVIHTETHASRPKRVTHATHACHKCPGMFTSRSKLNRHLKQVCEKDKLEEELASYYQDGA